jgi:hypothetical protein
MMTDDDGDDWQWWWLTALISLPSNEYGWLRNHTSMRGPFSVDIVLFSDSVRGILWDSVVLGLMLSFNWLKLLNE